MSSLPSSKFTEIPSDYNEHDYFKLKFEDKHLSEYEFLLWEKLFYFIHCGDSAMKDQPTPEVLEAFIETYSLPMPTNGYTIPDIFHEMKQHEYIKLQDETGKYLFGPASRNHDCMPSFQINRFQRSLNNAFEIINRELAKGNVNKEVANKTIWITDAIKGLNAYVGMYFMHTYMRANNINTLTDESIKNKSYPYSKFMDVCKTFEDIIFGLCAVQEQLNDAPTHIRPEQAFSLALPSILILKGFATYSCLCSLLLDTVFASFHQGKNLWSLVEYLHFIFHNSCIYKIEAAQSEVQFSTPISQRDQKCHTTQLKFFLFDKHSKPRVVRIDFPHQGEEFLHINLFPIYSDKEERLNHKQIGANLQDIKNIFTSLREAMSRECSQMISIEDTYRDDDAKVLDDMKLFLSYDNLAKDYILQESTEGSLLEIRKAFNNDNMTVEDALLECSAFFCNK